jgi:hypothetical protein
MLRFTSPTLLKSGVGVFVNWEISLRNGPPDQTNVSSVCLQLSAAVKNTLQVPAKSPDLTEATCRVRGPDRHGKMTITSGGMYLRVCKNRELL